MTLLLPLVMFCSYRCSTYYYYYYTSDYGEHVLRFELDRPFPMPPARSSSVTGLCSRPRRDELICTAEEEGSGRRRRLVSRMRFGPAGMTETKTNEEAGVTGTKFYLRVEEDEEGIDKEELLGHEYDDDGDYYNYDDEEYEYLQDYFEEAWV